MPIIVFFGPDGSGKSTLVKALTLKLQKRKMRVKEAWMRGSHTLIPPLAKVLSHFRTFKGSENPYYIITIPKKMKRLWQFLEFVNALPIIVVRFLIPSLIGYSVLADRYTLDLAVWICLTTCDYSFLKKFEAKALIALTMRANTKFFVIASLEKLKNRAETLWFQKEQSYLYSKLAKTVGAHRIDTTDKPVKVALKEALKLLP